MIVGRSNRGIFRVQRMRRLAPRTRH
jgi:hypothetical protein